MSDINPTMPRNGMGNAALVMGILQFVCLGTIGSILAIVFGKIGMDRATAGEATNGDIAKWGFWLGIVGLILTVVALVFVFFFFVIAASTS
jgi:hypothetical protein